MPLPPLPHRKGALSASMRCRITASVLAGATLALCMPARLAMARLPNAYGLGRGLLHRLIEVSNYEARELGVAKQAERLRNEMHVLKERTEQYQLEERRRYQR